MEIGSSAGANSYAAMGAVAAMSSKKDMAPVQTSQGAAENGGPKGAESVSAGSSSGVAVSISADASMASRRVESSSEGSGAGASPGGGEGDGGESAGSGGSPETSSRGTLVDIAA